MQLSRVAVRYLKKPILILKAKIDMGRLLINTDYKLMVCYLVEDKITGSVDNPQFNGYISSDALSVNGELLNDIHGRVYADKSVVNVQISPLLKPIVVATLLKVV